MGSRNIKYCHFWSSKYLQGYLKKMSQSFGNMMKNPAPRDAHNLKKISNLTDKTFGSNEIDFCSADTNISSLLRLTAMPLFEQKHRSMHLQKSMQTQTEQHGSKNAF